MTNEVGKLVNTFVNPFAWDPRSYHSLTNGANPDLDALGHGVTLGLGAAAVTAALATLFRDSRLRKAKKLRQGVVSSINAQQPILSPDPSLHDTKAEEAEKLIGSEPLSKVANDGQVSTLGSAWEGLKNWYKDMRSGASEAAPALAIGGASLGAVIGYALTQKILTDRDTARSKAESADVRNRLDKLMYDEYMRTRGVVPTEQKTAAKDGYEKAMLAGNEGAGNQRGSVEAGVSTVAGMYLIYALAAAAISFHLAKKFTDSKDPSRNKLKALELMTKRRLLYARPPEFVPGTDLDAEAEKLREAQQSGEQPVAEKPKVQQRLSVTPPKHLPTPPKHLPTPQPKAEIPVDASDPIAAMLNA